MEFKEIIHACLRTERQWYTDQVKPIYSIAEIWDNWNGRIEAYPAPRNKFKPYTRRSNNQFRFCIVNGYRGKVKFWSAHVPIKQDRMYHVHRIAYRIKNSSTPKLPYCLQVALLELLREEFPSVTFNEFTRQLLLSGS